MAKKKVELKKLGIRKREIVTDEFEPFEIEFDTPGATALNVLQVGVTADMMGTVAGSNAETVVSNFLLRHLKSWTLPHEIKRETFDALPTEIVDAIIGAMRAAGYDLGN
jgi:hypothetical protein